jgi:predicted DNA binding protein
MTDGHDGPRRAETERFALLARAVQRGYYDVPRRVSLAELARRSGLSDAAVSRRLRRETRRLVSETVLSEDPSTDRPD